MNSSLEYIYLIQLREFVNSNQNIYKIGRTKQSNTKRFNTYPKNSKLFLLISVQDCIRIEKLIITYFKLKYIQRKDIGNEYFEGDHCIMIDDIVKRKYISGCQQYHENNEKINENTNVKYGCYKCEDCNKYYTSELNLKRHEEKCKKISSLQCETCGYSTSIKCNFIKHQNRKNKCKSKVNQVTPGINTLTISLEQVQSNQEACEITSGTNSEISTQQNIKKRNVFPCVRCKKILHSKQSLQKHENICNGLNSLQCPTCEKWFSCRHSKYIHKKKERCVPKKLLYDVHNEKTTNNAESSGVNNMSNTLSQNNIVCETITNNINNTSNTQHIHINVFGSEDIKYLSQDENLM